MRETWVWSLGWEDPQEKEMAAHSSIVAWKIPWTEEPGRLQSMGLQRVRHDWVTEQNWTEVTLFLNEWMDEVAQFCPTLCNPMDCSLPRSSIHGIFQARILAWIAISFSRKSSWPRDWILVSHIAGWLLNELQFIQSNSGFHCKQFFPSPLWFITAKRDGLCL